MSSLLNKGIATLVVGASLVSIAAPAEARRRHHRGGDGDTAWAIGAGILGLGIVAAIASNDGRRYRDRYRGDYYDHYDRGGYDQRYGYDDRYYDDRYYRRGDRYGYGDRDCYTRRVWDPYQRREVRVRHCDGY